MTSDLTPCATSDKFYAEVLLPEMGEFNQLCFYNDVPVGLITCKLKPPASSGPGERELYISTLGVLAPYRRQGLASRMVDYVAEAALNGVQVPAPPAPPVPGAKKSAKAPATAPTATSSGSGKTKDAPPPTVTAKITKASIHVHTGDAEAREFWERQGFEVRWHAVPTLRLNSEQVESTVDGYYSKLQVRCTKCRPICARVALPCAVLSALRHVVDLRRSRPAPGSWSNRRSDNPLTCTLVCTIGDSLALHRALKSRNLPPAHHEMESQARSATLPSFESGMSR